MKVNQQFVFDDMSLRKIGKAVGKRSGKAKRSEVRVWLNGVVGSAVTRLEMPVMRRKREPKAAPVFPDYDANAVRCTHCGTTFADHGQSSKACPLSKTYSKPTKFQAVAV